MQCQDFPHKKSWYNKIQQNSADMLQFFSGITNNCITYKYDYDDNENIPIY